ncbi:MAG TPA: DUF2490 domain-containing protein [Chitinophagaceae bacterium]
MKIAIVITLLTIFSLGSSAQDQFTGWLASFNTVKIGKKTSLHTDIQFRSSDDWEHSQTFLLRPGINFHLNKKLTLTAGYAYIHNRRTISGTTDYLPEHRLWEQLLINHKWKNISVSHRFRLEQRFIPRVIVQPDELNVDGFVMMNRFRYFIRNIIPFKSQPTFSKGMFGALQNEVFVNVTGKRKTNGEFFDQNRLYIATGYRISPKADIEVGYMYQYVNGSGSQFSRIHILQLAGYLRL